MKEQEKQFENEPVLASKETSTGGDYQAEIMPDIPTFAFPKKIKNGRNKPATRVEEIIEQRGTNSKMYRMSDGTQQIVFYPNRIPSFDEELGASENVFEESEDKHCLICKQKDFKVKFNCADDSDELYRIERGEHRVTVCTSDSTNRNRKRVKPRLHKKDLVEMGEKDVLTYVDSDGGVDYEYSVNGGGVKENIVVREKQTSYRYQFVLKCENVFATVDETQRRVAFTSIEAGNEVFYIPEPYMIDANGVVSTAVTYETEMIGPDRIRLTVVASEDYMNAEERAFPVIIDPQIKLAGESAMTTYSWANGQLYSAPFHTVGTTGNGDGLCNEKRMYIHMNMPNLPHNPRIRKAELVLFQKEQEKLCAVLPLIGLYHVDDNICVGHCTPIHDTDLIDYARMTGERAEDTGLVTYRFDVTSLADQINRGEVGSQNLVVKMLDETSEMCNSITLYGSAYDTANAPQLVVTYETSYGVNTSYRTHTHKLGRFGMGSVDLQCGNLMFESDDFVWLGKRMPVTIKHLFNSVLAGYTYTSNSSIKLNTANFASMKLGYGFKLNLMQSMMPTSFVHDGELYSGYVYISENGEDIYFKESQKSVCCASNTQCYNLYEDVNRGDMMYDPVKLTLLRDEYTYLFDLYGRLVKISDASGNHMDIVFSMNRITLVTDGAGRTFNFAYDDEGQLVSIIAPNSVAISYQYSNGLLTGIDYPDGEKVVLTYLDNQPERVILKDNEGCTYYTVAYTHRGNCLESITEYGVDNAIGVSTNYAYSAASGRTLVTTVEHNEEMGEESTNNTITTTYTFDDDGNVISSYIYSADTGNIGGIGETSGINPYDGGVGYASNINNLLTDHGFDNLTAWSEMPTNSVEFNVRNYANEAYTKFGRKVLRMQSYNAECLDNGVYQMTDILPAGAYAYSVYIRVLSSFSGTAAGAFIRVTDASGKVLGVSERLTKNDTGYTRLIVPFEIASEQSVQVQILANGRGTIYADGAQLENNSYANAYNMLENGNFERGTAGWLRTSGVSYDSDTRFNMSNSLCMIGSLDSDRYAYQEIAVCTKRSTRETYTLSGWAKGYGLPNHKRTGCTTPQFRLRALIKYSDTTHKEYGTEEYVANFSPCTEEWQFASVSFAKSKFRTVEYIRVYCDYGYNSGTVYFDNIQLVRNKIETNLSDSDFAAPSMGMSSKTTITDTAPAFEEAKDKFGNALTETNFTDGEFGTIYRSFKFNEDADGMAGGDAGNNLVEEIDERGYKTVYTVDGDTSRKKAVIDRLGHKIAYDYDNSGRIVKVTSRDTEDTNLANISYTYGAFDHLTEITRGDGMTYALAYNGFHRLESIGIKGGREALIRYAYKNGNGRLKQKTFANGHTMKATYNSIGQMIAEKWFETEAQAADPASEAIAYSKFVYDGEGNIVRSIDIVRKKEYNYYYEEGRIIRATELDIELTGDIVTEKSIVYTINYAYDSFGLVSKKTVVHSNGTNYTVFFDNREDGVVSKIEVNGRTIASHSNEDSFGRQTFDELQVGSDFLSRQFGYHSGEVTREHKDKRKVKSSATSHLVSQITLSNGATFSYGYDAEERITSVVETYTVDGTLITNTTSYTYDALGQLLTETVNGAVINSMEYDNYGNIVKKNDQCYAYDHATWKDLLTSWGNETIEYDENGNPTSYLGHTLSWEHGRRLKSYDNTVFTYNASGVRTQKTVDNVVHNYALDGIMVLCESWGDNTLVPLYDSEKAVCGILYNDRAFYFHKNLQGDVVALTDDNGDVVVRYSYDAWGVCSVVQDASGIEIAQINPYRYRGYYYDNDTGLYYLQSRYYDPKTGRFLNPDSIEYLNYTGTVISNNLICYCENDPVNATDNYGHSWFKDKIVGGIDQYAKKAADVLKATVSYCSDLISDAGDALTSFLDETVTILEDNKGDSREVISAVAQEIFETSAGFVAQKVADLKVKAIVGVATIVIPDQDVQKRIKIYGGHIIDTINNETAKDYWNIYCVELGEILRQKVGWICGCTWGYVRTAWDKFWLSKDVNDLKVDWKQLGNDILVELTASTTEFLNQYGKMKVEPLSIDQSNENFKQNNRHVVCKNWYLANKRPQNCDKHMCADCASLDKRYIKDQDNELTNMRVGDDYDLGDKACGFVASYNVGVRFGKNVDLPSIIYWYEQNAGIILGSEFGVNPNSIPEYLDMIDLEAEVFDSLEDLEKYARTPNAVFIICRWNHQTVGSAHYFLVETTREGLVSYNAAPAFGKTFYEMLNGGRLIRGYRIRPRRENGDEGIYNI